MVHPGRHDNGPMMYLDKDVVFGTSFKWMKLCILNPCKDDDDVADAAAVVVFGVNEEEGTEDAL